MRKFIVLFLLLLSCGPLQSGWDLNKPIFVSVNSDVPNSDLFFRGINKAIKATGGIITSTSTIQILYISSGNPNSDLECKDKNRAAVAILKPDGNRIVVCPVVNNPTQAEADAFMYHELGHILSFRTDHLPCESKAIMAPTITCHGRVDVYPKLDVDYICSTGHTMNGMCK